ncbi:MULTISPECIES: efflux RND transporter periplasmic adaptor subunit [Gammaproteobacteria]|uniref:efflux RND transporter periplasmic adaptor subunit n=1 Tax=Gammaproteobacteria TaxID=1236 RepID=UPI0005683BCA|nr:MULTISPECIES: efflux RND transporter periplasmic adaptor subunit [unclassified Shewanella]MCU7977339.1 efflux RND transporter periplasmic adaptor subunit [Shewanella sp. SW36]MCU7992596.1 efflux RND transporter periplasmic adaptor subunit [Shewanella sp. SW1]MCU8053707.1 efflux RND transporter periplasmic adaptor subunit [Shewanella sp. SM43]
MSSSTSTAVAVTLLAALIAGCAKKTSPVPVAPRPVKVEVVSSSTLQASESFIGTLRARQRSELGFESSGRISAILVDVGDRVKSGQVLARLDESPALRHIEKAEADRTAAVAALAERATQLRQNESLAKDQIVSPITLESVQTQHRIAQSQLQAAEAALALARRELALSRITAPFDGVIVARNAQPFADISAGLPVFQIEAGQTLEVVAMLPEAVAARIAPGESAQATITQTSQPATKLPLKLERISSRNESGSLVQAIFRLDGATPTLRSGAMLSLELPGITNKGMSVPAAALLPGVDSDHGSVYLLEQTKLVKRTVQLNEGLLPDGRIPVKSGLNSGDRVVIAGAAFLVDGQAAVEHASTTLLHGGKP